MSAIKIKYKIFKQLLNHDWRVANKYEPLNQILGHQPISYIYIEPGYGYSPFNRLGKEETISIGMLEEIIFQQECRRNLVYTMKDIRLIFIYNGRIWFGDNQRIELVKQEIELPHFITIDPADKEIAEDATKRRQDTTDVQLVAKADMSQFVNLFPWIVDHLFIALLKRKTNRALKALKRQQKRKENG